MPGLFDLPDTTVFDVDATTTRASVTAQRSPGGPVETAATCGCWPDPGPSDLDWADRIAQLLALEHQAIVDGFAGVGDRLRFAALADPVAAAALSYAVNPDDVALARLKRACAEYHDQLGAEGHT